MKISKDVITTDTSAGKDITSVKPSREFLKVDHELIGVSTHKLSASNFQDDQGHDFGSLVGAVDDFNQLGVVDFGDLGL